MVFRAKFKKQMVLLLAIPLFLIGCISTEDGQKKLKYYCPKLDLKIYYESSFEFFYYNNYRRSMYICSYDRIYESYVESYFLKGNNGYSKTEENDFFKKEIDDTLINKHDWAVGKKTTTNNRNSIVIFDKTKQKIIIVEYSKKQRSQ